MASSAATLSQHPITRRFSSMHRQADRLAQARRSTRLLFALMAALLLLASLAQPAESQTYKVIHNFTNRGADGATPYGGPVLDRLGNLLGTTYLGGKYGSGSVYKLLPLGSSWAYTSIYSLAGQADGAGPAFGTLAFHDDAVYGTTEGGGYLGTAFKVGPCGSGCPEAVIHSFGHGTDGNEHIGGAVVDNAGNGYGTTLPGGGSGNGTVSA